MRQFNRMVSMVLLFSCAAALSFAKVATKTSKPAASPNGSVTIQAPTPKEIVKGNSVAVHWKLVKEGLANHVHLYVDGKFEGPKYGSSYTVKDLTPGKHTIQLRVATKNHHELGPKAMVSITVQGKVAKSSSTTQKTGSPSKAGW